MHARQFLIKYFFIIFYVFITLKFIKINLYFIIVNIFNSLKILDTTTLTKKQLATAEKVFEEFKDKKFLPLHEIETDTARGELDEKVLSQVLGFEKDFVRPNGALRILRMKMSREPSIRGTKKLKEQSQAN